MAKMGGIRSPNGIRKPSVKGGMSGPKMPGDKVTQPSMPAMGGMNTAPNMGFKKGGLAKKAVGGKRKKK